MNPWAKAVTDTFMEALGVAKCELRFFREENEGLLDIIDGLTAEQASTRLPNCSSIVAHTRHTLAYIESDLDAIRGGQGLTDWEETWSIQEMDEAEWQALRADLRNKSGEWIGLINANPNWEDSLWMRGAIGSAAHAAYHLGAIRQLSANLINYPLA